MPARSKARKRAVDLLFEADLRRVDPATTLAERLALGDPPISDYTAELVRGVAEHADEIDALLARYSQGWSVERMPPVDRAVLRLGVFELLCRPDVPDAVVLDEAIELVKSLSTAESPAFVNGVLGRVVRERPESELTGCHDGEVSAT
jgi:transcription antitermination protein NusB